MCFINNKYLFSAMFLGLGLLCRQYIFFAVCAMWSTKFLESLYSHNWKAIKQFTVYLAIAVLPLAILMILWGGMAPHMGTQKWIVYGVQRWSPQSFIMYIAFSGLYLLPVIVITKKKKIQCKMDFLHINNTRINLFPLSHRSISSCSDPD
jgi:cytochrome bd-type quinol oxidase subunit 1